jgi:SAM-dependent methyltransferase
MLVLGCGRGHDALLFARAGFRVTGVDYAPSAIAAATQAASAQGLQVEFLQQDIFDLPPAHAEQFDYVVEHTCYCAIDPALRDRYVDLVVQLLKPGGRLIALFFTHNRPGGPPYGATKAEIATRFGRQFECEHLELNPHSVESRRQEEHLGIFQKPQA